MIITAFDLGTTFGWATNRPNDQLRIGSVELAIRKQISEWGASGLIRRKDPRYWRFKNEAVHLAKGSSVIIFEDVLFSNGRCQCHLWATWRAALWDAFSEEQLVCVPTNVLKKFACGNGNANKPDMARAMADRTCRFSLTGPKEAKQKRERDSLVWDYSQEVWHDDNAVDAYWLFQWAKENVQR